MPLKNKKVLQTISRRKIVLEDSFLTFSRIEIAIPWLDLLKKKKIYRLYKNFKMTDLDQSSWSRWLV